MCSCRNIPLSEDYIDCWFLCERIHPGRCRYIAAFSFFEKPSNTKEEDRWEWDVDSLANKNSAYSLISRRTRPLSHLRPEYHPFTDLQSIGTETKRRISFHNHSDAQIPSVASSFPELMELLPLLHWGLMRLLRWSWLVFVGYLPEDSEM